MKAWAVTGDTSNDKIWGMTLCLLGVYTEKEKAIERAKAVEENKIACYVCINEIDINKDEEICVGVYEE